jgi:hypothetical protein
MVSRLLYFNDASTDAVDRTVTTDGRANARNGTADGRPGGGGDGDGGGDILARE